MRPDSGTSTKIENLPKGVIALHFKNVHEELLAFRKVAERKLAPEARYTLNGLASDLEQIARAAGPKSWKTTKELKTLSSDGGHQRDQTGHGRSLYGTINFRWDVEPLGHQGPKNQPLNRYFVLRNSTVRIRLIDDEENEVTTWDFDTGDDNSPGCHFHAKFAETGEARRALFRDVDIPRLPTLIFMPTDAIEFVLGELWQDEWRKIAMSSTTDVQEWRRYPQERFCRLLEWYLEVVKNGLTGTPWTQLKKAKPNPKCFM
jgi:hypothetical protein